MESKNSIIDNLSFDDIDEIIEKDRLTEINHSQSKRSIPFEIIDDYGILKKSKKTPYYFRKINWNSHVKYDIRTWGEDGERPFKGITFSREELRVIYEMARTFIISPNPSNCFKDCSSGRIKCRIMRHLSTLKEYENGQDEWAKECNLVDWGYGIKLDVRSWKNNYERSGKGISLDVDEARSLIRLIEKNHII